MDTNINKIDLTNIVSKVCIKNGMSNDMAVKAEMQYRQYLTLRSAYPEMILVPPMLADKLWHEHIMHSEKYMADCDTLFGSYLHHHEGEPETLLIKGWENTKNLFMKEFNVDLMATGETASPCR